MGKILFGQKLREVRELRGLERQELATKLRVSLRAIEQWERGEREPMATALAHLSAALGVSCEAFTAALAAKDPPKPKRPRGRPRKSS